jgi:ABC-type siderophore export system fused ATPase/permease subunit
MKTLLRTLLALAFIVWLGAEIFLPIVAATTFNKLRPDTHAAGVIVGQLIRILHGMGLVSGMVALAVLALAPIWGIYKPHAVLAPMVLVVLMMAGTVYSQYGIIPAMERDRIAAGGAIDTTDQTNPTTHHFNQLHHRSELVEEAILLMGLVSVVLVAWAEG